MSSKAKNNHNKNTQKVAKTDKKAFSWWLIPLILVIAVIPLITIIHVYVCGLETNPWFSIGGKLYDFFLYYKSFFLRLVGVIILFSLCYLLPFGQNAFLKEKKTIAPTIAIGVFGLLSLLSAIVSKHSTVAFFGGYEQFEGWFVVLTYILCFYIAFGFIRTKELLKFILDVILVGSIIVGILGTFQAFGIDWIQSDWAKPILTQELLGQMDLSNFHVKLNFDVGMSYVTLYNPNYVGTYAAIIIPYCAYLIIRGEKLVRRLLAAASVGLMLVTLLASRSRTGIVGIAVGIILLTILIIPMLKKAKPLAFVFLGSCVIGVVLLVTLYPGFIGKLLRGGEEYYVESMDCTDSSLNIHQDDGKTIIATLDTKNTTENGWGKQPIESLISITDEAGNPINATKNEDDNSLTISQDGYHPFVISGASIRPENNSLAVFNEEYKRVSGKERPVTDEINNSIDYICFKDWHHEWRFTDVEGKLMIYNSFGRLDYLNPVEKVGFERNYHFGSRRGYIWSRTFPLLADHLILGVGRDNFVYEFPNNDYVGKTYMGYETQTVTKPHNMYLQIWMQDGLIALLALLFLYGLFIVRAFRLCFGKHRQTPGSGIDPQSFVIVSAASTTGYMIVGLANDSTITSAAIFWLMLGCGYAAEAICRKSEA